jgi:diguanylate cyclase (GGDEF)-like protein
MDTDVLLDSNAETFCGVIIDALKELRSRGELVTPSLLHQELSKKQEYIGVLKDKRFAGSASECSCQADREVQENESPMPNAKGVFFKADNTFYASYIRKLQDFRLNLLSIFEDKLPEEHRARGSEVREFIIKSNEFEAILDLNDDILNILKATTRRVSGELEQFTNLVAEIGKDLVEIETDLMSTFSITHETFENNRAFNNTLAQNLGDISETIQTSTNVIELTGFVASKLSTIKLILEKKHKYDNLQMEKSAEEVKKLKRRLAGMKKEIGRVQNKASLLQEETSLDPLTGAYNRRAYEKRILEEVMRFKNHEEIFSILMIDIDHFKSINDQYGHWAGDRCLEELTKLIKRILRGTDFLARYGGDEFISILPGTDEEGIRIVSNRMREFIEKARFLYLDQEIPLTVSVGATTVIQSDQDNESIFKRVDNAMYEAKRTGRNRSVVS